MYYVGWLRVVLLQFFNFMSEEDVAGNCIMRGLIKMFSLSLTVCHQGDVMQYELARACSHS
jgi:hypothetical protein